MLQYARLEGMIMAAEYTYDEEKNFLHTRFYGVLTDEDLKWQAEAVTSDPRIRPGTREIVDLTGIEDIKASPESLKLIVATDRSHRDKLAGMRTAIVAPTDLLYGYSRMYEIFAELGESPVTIEVFRTIDEAREWLESQNNG
jgi:hypothetical protein